MTEYGKTYREFAEAGLAVPGTLIRVGGAEYLIGDINTSRGVCDDCTAFGAADIVLAYEVVWEP